MRVLVVEDEPALAAQVKQRLVKEGFAVDVAGDGKEGLFLGSEYAYDVAIVDLGLPKLDGFSLIKELRKRARKVPVLTLTARASWQDKVDVLNGGADDYVVKPFQMEELIARVQVLVRRGAGQASPVVQVDNLALDTVRTEARVDDQVLELTAYEYKVLEYLVMHQGKVVSKTELTEHIYEQDFDRDSNTIEVFVGRLRKKIKEAGGRDWISTLRGRGYRFQAAS